MNATNDLIKIQARLQNTVSESENRSVKSVKEGLTCTTEKGETADLRFDRTLKLRGTCEKQL